MLWDDIKQHPYWLAAAVAVHVLVLVLMTVNLSFEASPSAVSQVNVIKATAINSDPLEAQRQQQQREQKQRAAEQRAAQEKKRQAEAERVKTEQQRQLKLQAEQAAEKKRQAELKEKQEAEQKQQAELEAQRKAEEKAEQARQAELRRQEQKQLEEQARLQAERDAQQQAEVVALQRVLDRARFEYAAALRAHIQSNWTRPSQLTGTPSARIEVRQLPGGMIAGVRLLSCNGPDVFCRSVEAAVWQSDPLPPPPREELFEQTLVVTFEPE